MDSTCKSWSPTILEPSPKCNNFAVNEEPVFHCRRPSIIHPTYNNVPAQLSCPTFGPATPPIFAIHWSGTFIPNHPRRPLQRASFLPQRNIFAQHSAPTSIFGPATPHFWQFIDLPHSSPITLGDHYNGRHSFHSATYLSNTPRQPAPTRHDAPSP